MIKPSSNYRVEEDREPNSHTRIHYTDDLLNSIDNVLVYRCVLMLKEAFDDRSENLDISQDNVIDLIYYSDDLNMFSKKAQDMNQQ